MSNLQADCGDQKGNKVAVSECFSIGPLNREHDDYKSMWSYGYCLTMVTGTIIFHKEHDDYKSYPLVMTLT